MRVSTFGAAMAALLLVPAVAPAQSLGEAAARERARREKQKQGPAKVITEDDLRKPRSGQVSEFVTTSTTGGTAGTAPAGTEGKPVPGAGGTASPAPNASPSPAAASDAQRAAEQADWRDRITGAREDVTRMQAEVTRLEAALSDNTKSPYGPGRAAAADRLAEAKRLLGVAQGRVADLEARGREKGYN